MKCTLLLGLLLLVSGCAAQKPTDPAAVVSGVKLPEHISIMRPDASASPEMAYWLGEWAGQWNNNMDTVLVVREVHSGIANIIYGWGVSPNFGFTPGFERGEAKLTPTQLVFDSPSGAVIRFVKQKDGTLAASWYKGQYSSYARMVRVTAAK